MILNRIIQEKSRLGHDFDYVVLRFVYGFTYLKEGFSQTFPKFLLNFCKILCYIRALSQRLTRKTDSN